MTASRQARRSAQGTCEAARFMMWPTSARSSFEIDFRNIFGGGVKSTFAF
jgi:hypothetical protein